MDKRKIFGIIIIIIGILALVAVIYFMFFYSPTPTEQPAAGEKAPVENNTANLPVTEEKKTAVINIIEPPRPEEITADDLKRMAASFAERFGSYSNQANYGNIKDLKIFMSSSMKEWADDYIQKEIAKNADKSIYYGTTTKAAGTEVISFNETAGVAEILVNTQRRTASGVMNNAETSQQDILIKYVKEKGAWKVNSAKWVGAE
jgi:hypothetical protein